MKKAIIFIPKVLLALLLIAISFGFVAIHKAKTETLPKDYKDISKTQIYANDGTLIYELGSNKEENWVDFEEFPDYLLNAFIAIEDHNFEKHNGFDYKRIAKALSTNILTLSKKEGASTITQQYARNLYLTPVKTYQRKLTEAYYTIVLENNYTKNEIIEGYLNTIYFGHGIYGIKQASNYYFNKEVKDLTLLESVAIASIPKSPEYYSPINNKEANKMRRNLVLKQMSNYKLIDTEIATSLMNKELTTYGKITKNPDKYEAQYFSDIVLNEFNKLQLDLSNLHNIKIHTTLDIAIHNNAKEAMDTTIDSNSKIQGAVIVMDPNTGEVKSLLGGKNYFESTYNRALANTRHPGSTIKPFLYYQALESGFTPSTTFKSTPTTFYINDGETLYTPQNYNQQYANDDISMYYALATSDNIYAVKTHLYLGVDKFAQKLKKYGFDENIQAVPSLALGSLETSLLQMTKSYSMFANMGYSVSPRYITKITDADGNVLYESKIQKQKVLNEDTTFVLNHMMTGMFDTTLNKGPLNVTGSSIKAFISRKYAGKSGSTDYDNWMIGYTKELIVGVWTGYDKPEIIPNEEAKYAKKIWVKTIEKSLENYETEWYTPPKGVYSIVVNPITGDYKTDRNQGKRLYYIKTKE